MGSTILIGIGMAIVTGFLWAIYESAKEAGRKDEQARIVEANAAIIRKQMAQINKNRTVDDVADSADRGEF